MADEAAAAAHDYPTIDPTSFDVVLCGTGLPESVLAAACAAAGKTVLHVDPSPFYGSHYSSVPLSSLASFLSPDASPSFSTAAAAAASGSHTAVDLHCRSVYSDVETSGTVPEPARRFTVDLVGPRVLYCADEAVDLLLRSGGSHHVEFKSVDGGSLLYWDGCLYPVPDSRNAIFKDTTLERKEKFVLHKFFNIVKQHIAATSASADERGEEDAAAMISEEDLDHPFIEFLNQHQLSPKMRAVVLYAIAMADYDQDGPEPSDKLITTREGIKTIALYSSSIGRFANAEGAFIYPMYGHGELPQAFCRCAAVKGALYVLRMPVAALLMDEEKKHFVGARLASGQDISCKQLIIDPSYKISTLDVQSDDSNTNFPRSVARGICIFSKSVKQGSSNFLVVFPPKSLGEEQVAAVRLLQLSSNLAICPPGMFIAYLSTPCTDASAGKQCIKKAMDALFSPQDSDGSEGHLESTSESTDDMKPALIWSCVYVQEITQGTSTSGSLWSFPMPDENLDYRNILARAVRHIACGSNFTAAICQHKWVSGAEQSQCASCRQPFGFTRKRHNCHNCGLVHCNACTSRKALRAALAPNPAKPYRVCDSCFMKLNSAAYSSAINQNKRKEAVPRHSGESNPDTKLAKAIVPSNLDMIRSLDSKAAKQGKKTDALSFLRTPQMTSLLQLRDIALSGGIDLNKSVPRAVRTSAVRSLNSSRAVSPFSRKPSPPRSTTPVPTTHGLSIAKTAADSLAKTNEMLNQEVERLRAQVDNLRHRCELQELELQKSAKKVQEAMTLVSEESAKSKAAKEVIKSLTAQLKDMAERLPPDQGAYDGSEAKQVHIPNGIEMYASIYTSMNGIHQPRNEPVSAVSTPSLNMGRASHPNGISSQHKSPGSISENSEVSAHSHRVSGHPDAENFNRRGRSNSDEMLSAISRADDSSSKDARSLLNGEDGYKSRSAVSIPSNQVQAEWIEQYEPGVYITLTTLRDGTRDLKRVRFSRRRFGEHQAESWWNENRDKVYEKYNVRSSERVSSASSIRSAR